MQNPRTASYWKEKLQMISHVEGGAYKETYRAALTFPQQVLTPEHQGARNASTAIYFLLQYGEFSAFHRIASDEMWHYYDGTSLYIYEIKPDGSLHIHKLGLDVEAGEQPQVLIPAGSWFASRVEAQDGYCLCGCTVSPGFDFTDFELATKSVLQQQYPQHADVIATLTR
ncbi:hypothetical protein CAP35_06760 [Chitinophagaceae bacterium IBVUCB1]|nr:hypothetical protein CAP35_06760 [Chitinophagaceae bacterium IBVUCB1]